VRARARSRNGERANSGAAHHRERIVGNAKLEIDSACESTGHRVVAEHVREIYGNPRASDSRARPIDLCARARVNRQDATREAESAGTLFDNVTDRWMWLAVTETSRFTDDLAVDRWVTSLANWELKGRRGGRLAPSVNGKLMMIISQQRY